MKEKLITALALWCSLSLVAEHSGRQPTPEGRRPLSEPSPIFESSLDLFVEKETNWGSHCQSTLIAKNPIENSFNSLCRFGIATAAHCVDDPFINLQFGDALKIPKESILTCIPTKYRRNKLFKGKDSQDTPSDIATLIFDSPCDKIPLKSAVLAPVGPDGTTQVDRTDSFFVKKRKGKAPDNSGGAKVLQAELLKNEGHSYTFRVPSPQGVAMVGGDSGGPLYNSKGQLICPLAHSTYEYLRLAQKLELPEAEQEYQGPVDPFEVSCDKIAVRKLKEHLEHFQLSQDSTVLVPAKLSFEKHRDCR